MATIIDSLVGERPSVFSAMSQCSLHELLKLKDGEAGSDCVNLNFLRR